MVLGKLQIPVVDHVMLQPLAAEHPCFYLESLVFIRNTTEGAKSQYPYVGSYTSAVFYI